MCHEIENELHHAEGDRRGYQAELLSAADAVTESEVAVADDHCEAKRH